MPYAIEYESEVTGEIRTGPKLMIAIERPLVAVKKRPMTKAEADAFCEKVNNDSTYKNAVHYVVRI